MAILWNDNGRVGIVRFPPLGGCREGLTCFYIADKPLPATSHASAPLPSEGI